MIHHCIYIYLFLLVVYSRGEHNAWKILHKSRVSWRWRCVNFVYQSELFGSCTRIQFEIFPLKETSLLVDRQNCWWKLFNKHVVFTIKTVAEEVTIFIKPINDEQGSSLDSLRCTIMLPTEWHRKLFKSISWLHRKLDADLAVRRSLTRWLGKASFLAHDHRLNFVTLL